MPVMSTVTDISPRNGSKTASASKSKRLAIPNLIASRFSRSAGLHPRITVSSAKHPMLPIMSILGTKTAPDMSSRHTAVHIASMGELEHERPPMATSLPLEKVQLAIPEAEAAAKYALAEKASATRRAYRSDFKIFRTWCRNRGIDVLPATPEAVAAFLAAEADRKIRPATIGRRLAAIRYAHRLAGVPVPTDDERVRATMRGIRRSLGAAPVRKAPATAEKIVAMAPPAGEHVATLRDRALLLFGFASAMRRSELAALDVEDIEETAQGLLIMIRRSKADQEGYGNQIAVPLGTKACPVAALVNWLRAAAITNGPVFRPIGKGGHVQNTRLTDRSIANIVKGHAARAGLDPASYSPHSLRSGFLTAAAANGASIFRLADQSRHKSIDVLRGYVRYAELFRDHPGANLL
jgi:site-specific recombinase XerD